FFAHQIDVEGDDCGVGVNRVPDDLGKELAVGNVFGALAIHGETEETAIVDLDPDDPLGARGPSLRVGHRAIGPELRRNQPGELVFHVFVEVAECSAPLVCSTVVVTGLRAGNAPLASLPTARSCAPSDGRGVSVTRRAAAGQ